MPNLEQREICFNSEFPLLGTKANGYKDSTFGLLPPPFLLNENLDLTLDIKNKPVAGMAKIQFHKTPFVWLREQTFPQVMPVGFKPMTRDYVFEFDFRFGVPRDIPLSCLRDKFKLLVNYRLRIGKEEIISIFLADDNVHRLSTNEPYRYISFSRFSMIYPETSAPGRLFLPDDLNGLMTGFSGRLIMTDEG